jgi:hypothetical protein
MVASMRNDTNNTYYKSSKLSLQRLCALSGRCYVVMIGRPGNLVSIPRLLYLTHPAYLEETIPTKALFENTYYCISPHVSYYGQNFKRGDS